MPSLACFFPLNLLEILVDKKMKLPWIWDLRQCTPERTNGTVASGQGHLGQQHRWLNRNLQILNQWSIFLTVSWVPVHSHTEWRLSRENSSADGGNEAHTSVNICDHTHSNATWAHTLLLSQMSIHDLACKRNDRQQICFARKDTEYTNFWIPGPK